MEELKELLENVDGTYYDFVRSVLADVEENMDMLDETVAYIKDNPEVNSSDIIGWLFEAINGVSLDSLPSIVVDDDEVDDDYDDDED